MFTLLSIFEANGAKRDRATRKKESDSDKKAKVGQRNDASTNADRMDDTKNNARMNDAVDAVAVVNQPEQMDVDGEKQSNIVPDAPQVVEHTSPPEEMRQQSIVTVADVHTPSESQMEQQATEKKVDAAIDAEATKKIIEPSAKSQTQPAYEIKLVDADEPKTDKPTKKKVESTNNNVEKDSIISDSVEALTMENADNPTAQAATGEAASMNDAEPTITEKPNTGETNGNAVDESKQAEPQQDTATANVDVNVEPPLAGDEPTKPNDDLYLHDAHIDDEKPVANDTPKHSIDSSKSFQVLPNTEHKSSDNQNQDNDTGNLDPPTEVIRKTSFTVLKSDESIDDLLLGLANEHEQAAASEHVAHDAKHPTRPKSFKVLNARDASGEDIILHQSSDQETGGIDNDDEYSARNFAARSGKYSDSELMKFDGQLNGRRKKYKKRAKSVKQLTILDASLHNKDQDSGFEPSPRTLRSQKASTIRSIYTANLPERPRIGDTVDGRSMLSTRHETQRKPGDKNAVNMSTVSQTLQRNIRRYYMEHKIFQHLLELKSLQIRSSKVNESLLVKRAVDDYHKSTMELGLETGGTLKRYPYKEYTFKNFEIFLYEVLKSLQKNGSNNFQNISDVYLEVGCAWMRIETALLRNYFSLNRHFNGEFCSFSSFCLVEL